MTRFDLPILPERRARHAPGPEPSRSGPDPDLADVIGAVARWVREGAVVAFSGGVDSAFLLWVASEAARSGGRVLAVTTVSPSTPSADLADARDFARELGVEHLCLESGEVRSEAYARNDRERCWVCKDALFDLATRVAGERSLRWVLYGYTASDHHDVRPGHRAALEHGVVAPLSDLGLRKERIRTLLGRRHPALAEKPASPCLASRITTGIRVTPERLGDVEAMESILRNAGVRVCRARVCEAADDSLFFRIEVGPGEEDRVLACREHLSREARRRGYRSVTLDPGGYRTGGGTA